MDEERVQTVRTSLGKGDGLARSLGSGEDGEKALGLQVMEPQTFHGSQPEDQ